MQRLFQEFQNYKFEDDLNYQNGIQKLNSKTDNSCTVKGSDCSKAIKDCLETRHFYWSKFFESFDLNQYKEWISKLSDLEGEGTQANTEASSNNTKGTCDDTKDTEGVCDDTEAISNNVEATSFEEKSLSFQEIIEMVQKGESVPGIRMIPDVVHSQKESSKSSLEPIKKPWEMN